MINKSKLNFIIDAIMFLFMMALAGIGFLMKYVLLSGQDNWDKYGKNVDSFFWGMDRHQWGKTHLVVALILVGLLILHIILHWPLILNLLKKLIPHKIFRWIISSIFIIFSFILIFLFLAINPVIVDLKGGRGRHTLEQDETTELNKPAEISPVDTHKNPTKQDKNTEPVQKDTIIIYEHIESSIDITGQMSLNYISRKYDVPVEHLKEKLNLPLSTSNDINIGRLRRSYNFTMTDVRTIIEDYLESVKKLP